MPGLDRRVGGEQTLGLGLRHGLFERPAGCKFLAHQFQREEGGVAFVKMEHRGTHAEFTQQPHPADPEEDLLHDPRGAVSAVDPRGQLAIMRLVLRQVCVQQIHRHSAHVNPPRPESDHRGRDPHSAFDGLAACVQDRFERQVRWIQQRIILRLPIILVDGLHEIALAIKQADTHKPQAQIARRLGVVTSEHPQTAGRNRQRLGKAELRREIGDGALLERRRVRGCPGILLAEIAVEPADCLSHLVGELQILQARPQLGIGDLVQNRHGIMKKVLPTAR